MRPSLLRTHHRWVAVAIGAGLVLAGARCSSTTSNGTCNSDADGVVGGNVALDLKATDTSFSPTILKAQNLATVTLTLTNGGTQPHDFVIDCLPTPNTNGCPATSCFGDAAAIGPVPPDASATVTFTTPNPEGIYTFRSDLPGDTQTAPDGGITGLVGQFIVQ
jgi:hypothetical protein